MKRALLEFVCFLAFCLIWALAMAEGQRQADTEFTALRDIHMGYGGLYLKQADGTLLYMTNSDIRWKYGRRP